MAVPSNVLKRVQTFIKGELAWSINSFFALANANKRYKNFEKEPANLGDSVSFDLAPRMTSRPGLVISTQPSVQRPQVLTVTQAENSSAAYTNKQFIFNVEDYMERFGEAGAKVLGTKIEADVLKNVDSTCRILDPQNPNVGAYIENSGPYRFYGDGVTAINSYTQLAQALANYRSIGAAENNVMGALPMDIVPAIIGTGLNQFAPDRNNEIATSWMLGDFSDCRWVQSNLLPIHESGTIGNAGGVNSIMTVVSTNDPSGANITEITATEPTGSTELKALRVGDLCQFVDGVAGFQNMRFRTFIGYELSTQPVQFVVTEDASSSGGTVTFKLRTATNIGLVSAPNQNQNLNQAIQAGMKIQVAPSHRCGIIWSGNSLYLAMPQLPDEDPYSTVSYTDPQSGASIRHYWGSLFGQNNRSYVRDAIWGSTWVPENCMRIVLPL